MMEGRPLVHPDEIDSPESLRAALRALLYSGDESVVRSTEARGWDRNTDDEDTKGVSSMSSFPVEWWKEIEDIDKLISEEVCAAPTPMPTSNMLEKIDDMTEKLASWFSTPLPVYVARKLRYAFDEMAEIGSLLRGGVINAGEANTRFDTVLSEVAEIIDFSRFEV